MTLKLGMNSNNPALPKTVEFKISTHESKILNSCTSLPLFPIFYFLPSFLLDFEFKTCN